MFLLYKATRSAISCYRPLSHALSSCLIRLEAIAGNKVSQANTDWSAGDKPRHTSRLTKQDKTLCTDKWRKNVQHSCYLNDLSSSGNISILLQFWCRQLRRTNNSVRTSNGRIGKAKTGYWIYSFEEEDESRAAWDHVYLLPVAVGLCGLVVLDKLVVHKLQRERWLAHAARAHHDHLVQRGLRRRLLRHRARCCRAHLHRTHQITNDTQSRN